MHAVAGDRAQLHELLDATLRLQENGLPPELWEALLDEVDCLPEFLRVCLIMFNLHLSKNVLFVLFIGAFNVCPGILVCHGLSRDD